MTDTVREMVDQEEEILLPADGPVPHVPDLGPEPNGAKKVAIVGYTTSNLLTPWDDGFEVWICNDLHKHVPDKWDRLYDLHDAKEIVKDADHEQYLRKCQRPVFVWEARQEWPGSVSFPKDAVTDALGRYFTNSISWMTAHALLEQAEMATTWATWQAETAIRENPGLENFRPVMVAAARAEALSHSEIHVYGVDMAQGTEYAAQRPSCEYFLGIATGMGIKVYIPPESDLLKVIGLYGAEDDTPFRAKIQSRERDLTVRMEQMNNQYMQMQGQLNQLQGALEDVRYWKAVWLAPHANRDGSAKDTTMQQSDGAGVVSAMVDQGG